MQHLSGQPNLPDIYISSYTPTLSSLLRARSDVTLSPTTMAPYGQVGFLLLLFHRPGVKAILFSLYRHITTNEFEHIEMLGCI